MQKTDGAALGTKYRNFKSFAKIVCCCRTLRLHAVDLDVIFILLAGPDLLSLEMTSDEGNKRYELPWRMLTPIANLSALTRLQLSRYKRNTRLTTLQHLNLQELNLHSCPGAAEAILLPGTMTTLQKLHIWEDRPSQPNDLEAYNKDLADTESEGHQSAQKLHQLGQVLFSLPSLVQVSGLCPLFSCAMAEGLENWSVWKQKQGMFQEGVWKKLS